MIGGREGDFCDTSNTISNRNSFFMVLPPVPSENVLISKNYNKTNVQIIIIMWAPSFGAKTAIIIMQIQ